MEMMKRILARVRYPFALVVIAWIAGASAEPLAEVDFSPDLDVIASAYGNVRDTYFLSEELVGRQVVEGLGVLNPTVLTARGEYLVSGCSRKSCSDKVVLLMSNKNEILATGLVNSRCYLVAFYEKMGFIVMKIPD